MLDELSVYRTFVAQCQQRWIAYTCLRLLIDPVNKSWRLYGRMFACLSFAIQTQGAIKCILFI